MVTFNQSNYEEVYEYLYFMKDSFTPKLDSLVDISTYSKKIIDFAERIEFRENGKIFGLLAYYLNFDAEFAFITTISVAKSFQGKGIAEKLLVSLRQKLNNHSLINQIHLEVNKQNTRALNFYKKNSFTIFQKKDYSLILISPVSTSK